MSDFAENEVKLRLLAAVIYIVLNTNSNKEKIITTKQR